MRVLEYKGKIEKIIVERMSRLKDVKSIFVIGSMANADYCEKKVNDYDIRVLVSKIDEELFQEWTDTMKQCIEFAKNYPEINVSFSDLIGPVKYVYNDKTTFLIHGIILTNDALDNLGVIHKKSYYNTHYNLYGDDPLVKYNKLRVELNNVLFDTEGIDYCIDHLNDRKISYMKWIKKSESYFLISVDEDFDIMSSYEFVRYSVIKAEMNIIECMNDSHEDCRNILDDISDKVLLIKELDYNIYKDDAEKYIQIALEVLKYYRIELERN